VKPHTGQILFRVGLIESLYQAAGPPKETRDPMENHLEEGREAFAARKEVYDV
jgi:hypothetical protein